MQKFQYKGIQNLKEFSLKAELNALENSVYREWYEFARLSPVLWSAYQFNLEIKDNMAFPQFSRQILFWD